VQNLGKAWIVNSHVSYAEINGVATVSGPCKIPQGNLKELMKGDIQPSTARNVKSFVICHLSFVIGHWSNTDNLVLSNRRSQGDPTLT
jgi:hypothetical protein